MIRKSLIAVFASLGLAATGVQAQTEIQFWHSMGGALGDKVSELADGFNKERGWNALVSETLRANPCPLAAAQALLDGLRSIMPMAIDTKKKVLVGFELEHITLESISPELGEARRVVDAAVDGGAFFDQVAPITRRGARGHRVGRPARTVRSCPADRSPPHKGRAAAGPCRRGAQILSRCVRQLACPSNEGWSCAPWHFRV